MVADDTVVTAPISIVGGTGPLAVINNGVVTTTTTGQDAISVNSNADVSITGTGTVTNVADYGAGIRATAGQTGVKRGDRRRQRLDVRNDRIRP